MRRVRSYSSTGTVLSDMIVHDDVERVTFLGTKDCLHAYAICDEGDDSGPVVVIPWVDDE